LTLSSKISGKIIEIMDMTMLWLSQAIQPHRKLQLISKLNFTLLQNIFHEMCFILEKRNNHGYLALSRFPPGQLKSFYSSIIFEKSRFKKIGDSYLSLWDVWRNSFNIVSNSTFKNLLIDQKIKEYKYQIQNKSFNYLIGYEILGSECINQIYYKELVKQLKLNPLIKKSHIFIDEYIFKEFNLFVDISCPILIKTVLDYLIKEQRYNSKDFIMKDLFQGYKDSLIFWNILFDVLFSLDLLDMD
jgi:hypothetical protein